MIVDNTISEAVRAFRAGEPQPGNTASRHVQTTRGNSFLYSVQSLTEAEVAVEAERLQDWMDRRCIEGAPVFPEGTCRKCARQHLDLPHTCNEGTVL